MQPGARAAFSDRNSSVVLSAPGVEVIGAGPGGTYLQASGTSPAAAFVTGVAALIRSAYPRLSPAQVEQAMISSAARRPAAGYSPATGFGEVDAAAALRAAGVLSRASPEAGLAAGRHFGGAAPGPVQVTHRDEAADRRAGRLAARPAAGFLASLAVLVLTRRGRRAQHGPDPAPGGAGRALARDPARAGSGSRSRSAVTSSVCSNWAVRLRSLVTAVQPSSQMS